MGRLLQLIGLEPRHEPVRFIVATRQESRKARVARIHTELQLAVAVARLSPEERKAAVMRASIPIRPEEGRERA